MRRISLRAQLLSITIALLFGVAGLWMTWTGLEPKPIQLELAPLDHPRASYVSQADSSISPDMRVVHQDQTDASRPMRNEAPGVLGQFMDFIEVRSEDGHLRAVQIAAGANSPRLHDVGLKPGDLLIAINGVPIESEATAEDFLTSLAKSEIGQVTVVRNGVKYDLQLRLVEAGMLP